MSKVLFLNNKSKQALADKVQAAYEKEQRALKLIRQMRGSSMYSVQKTLNRMYPDKYPKGMIGAWQRQLYKIQKKGL